jgi:hypothetical protein
LAANLRSYDRLRATLLAPAPGVVQDQPVLITNLHLALYRYRADVAQRHDIATREGRRAFLEWLQVHGRAEMFGDPARPAAQVPPPTDSAGVNSIGYAYAEMGISEDMRSTAATLHGHGMPVAVFPLAARNGLPEGERPLRHLENPRMPFRTSMFHLPGLMQLLLFCSHGEAMFRDRHNIGIWAWELERWPREMALCCALNDEIWTMSGYIRDALAGVAECPLRVMPQTISVPDVAPCVLAAYGVPAGAFTFLVVFDAGSWLRRKNPLAAVDAFRRAFPAGDHVALVIKAMGGRRGGADGTRSRVPPPATRACSSSTR